MTAGAEVRRSAARAVTRAAGLTSWHSFSYGAHYDATNTHHAGLLALNDDTLAPGSGFDTHPHRDVEIVTWVLAGELEHRDSTGRHAIVAPGVVACLSTGVGVEHSEHQHGDGPVRYVQMWVRADRPLGEASSTQRDVNDDLAGGRLVPVVSGLVRDADTPALPIAASAALLLARLAAPDSGPGANVGTRSPAVTLPAAPFVHVYVARGRVDVEGVGELAEGDALRLTDSGPRTVTSAAAAELLVWELS